MHRWLAISLLLVSATLPAADRENEARVITGWSNQAKCIAAIHVQKINGREVAVQRMGFTIPAGRHRLSGKAFVDTAFCPTLGPFRERDRPEPLEAEFEAGKVYYVGLDHSSPNRRNWTYVIWQVHDWSDSRPDP